MYELSLDKGEMVTLVRAIAIYSNSLHKQMEAAETKSIHMLAAELGDVSTLLLKVSAMWDDSE